MATPGKDIVSRVPPAANAAAAAANLKTYVTSLNEYIQQVYPTTVGGGAAPAKDPNGEELMAALVAIQGDKEVQKLVGCTHSKTSHMF